MSQLAFCSIVMQNFQIFYGDPAMFVVTCTKFIEINLLLRMGKPRFTAAEKQTQYHQKNVNKAKELDKLRNHSELN